MRIAINLATRPYVELDRLLRRLRIALAGLAVLAVVLGVWLHSVNKRAAEQTAEVARLNAKADALTQERTNNEKRLRQNTNAATLNRNQFLNTLFTHKAFSWTAVLMDLEEVLPEGVQVTSIEPAVAANGDVTIRLHVVGARTRTVQLVKNLESTQHFIAPRLAGEAQQVADRGRIQSIGGNGMPQPVNAVTDVNGLPPVSGVEFEIVAGYNPIQPRLHEPRTRVAVPLDEDNNREVAQ